MTLKKWVVMVALALLDNASGLTKAGESGNAVVVLYNQRMPESREIAQYYAAKRGVPSNQLFGFDLPASEVISRTQFQDGLQNPLFACLETNGFFRVTPRVVPATREHPGAVYQDVTGARIRYAVLCYGIPVRIAPDTNLVENGMEKVRVELRRNEAAVDSELALLPLLGRKIHLFGPVNNALYNATDSSRIHPANGLLIVARLDGPSPGIARGLVDLALAAETHGLWGRAYFDARGLTNGEYKLGDDWIRSTATSVTRAGFETILDENPATFSAGFPLSQVALYAGWYDAHVSGPFTRPQVEFMPGAIAYHLHSYSGHEIRNARQHWVGPLLERGATATMGCVFEPYLVGTPNLAVFFTSLLRGFSFGEAAYASQSLLSWQTTVVGDPLYRPFPRGSPAPSSDGSPPRGKWAEWALLQSVNLDATNGDPPPSLIANLEKHPLRSTSAILEEKLADLYASQGQFREAEQACERALKLDPSPHQSIRLELAAARYCGLQGEYNREYTRYQDFLRNHTDYPESLVIYQKLGELARTLGKADEAAVYLREVDKLKPTLPPKAPEKS